MQDIIVGGGALYGEGERNRLNPLRFCDGKQEFCVHFKLPTNLMDRYYIDEAEKGEAIEKTVTISNVDYAIYTPTILIADTGEALIMYHGGDRGLFSVGQKITVNGKKI